MTKTNEKPLKAYLVTVDYEERCEIVFADSPSHAKAKCSLGGQFDYFYLRATRAKDFDSFVGKQPTVGDYLERDWWFPCTICDLETSLHHNPPTIVVFDKYPCCTEECAEKAKSEREI
jgi:hypothetical protein